MVNPDSPAAERTGLAEVTYDVDVTVLGEAALEHLRDAMQPAVDSGVRVEIGGNLAQYSMKPEPTATEVLGVLAAMVIRLVTFGSVVGMVLPSVIPLRSEEPTSELQSLMRILST